MATDSKKPYGSTDGPFIDNPNAPADDVQPVTTGMNPQPAQDLPVEKRMDEGVEGGEYSVDGRIVDALGRAK